MLTSKSSHPTACIAEESEGLARASYDVTRLDGGMLALTFSYLTHRARQIGQGFRWRRKGGDGFVQEAKDLVARLILSFLF